VLRDETVRVTSFGESFPPSHLRPIPRAVERSRRFDRRARRGGRESIESLVHCTKRSKKRSTPTVDARTIDAREYDA